MSGVHNFRLSTWKELENQFMLFCNPWSNSSTFCQSEKFIAGIGLKKGSRVYWGSSFPTFQMESVRMVKLGLFGIPVEIGRLFSKGKKVSTYFRAKDILIEKRERGLSVYFYLER